MLDISNICRICLKKEDPKLPIFTENDDKGESKPSLSEKIMSIAQVKVVKDDGLPMYICVKCYCQVDTTVEFKRLCEESFRFFTRQLDTLSNQPSASITVSPINLASDAEYNSSGELGTIPEGLMKDEVLEAECGRRVTEDGVTTQVFRINDETWMHNCDADLDPLFVKCEQILDYPNFEVDLSNVKIENGSEGFYEEELSNPLDLGSKEVNVFCGLEDDAGVEQKSNVNKSWKCRICDIDFSSQGKLAVHMIEAHRYCGKCRSFFLTDKDMSEHECEKVAADKSSIVGGPSVNRRRYCTICNKRIRTKKAIHMARHRKEFSRAMIEIRQTLRSHVTERRFVDGRISCNFCSAICFSEQDYLLHVTLYHNHLQMVYACFICKYRWFAERKRYLCHLRRVHNIVVQDVADGELTDIAEKFPRNSPKNEGKLVKQERMNIKTLNANRKLKFNIKNAETIKQKFSMKKASRRGRDEKLPTSSIRR